jgi:hypothetical protein
MRKKGGLLELTREVESLLHLNRGGSLSIGCLNLDVFTQPRPMANLNPVEPLARVPVRSCRKPANDDGR